MKGGNGNGKIVPLYKEPKNSPYIPEVQKNIYNERLVEKGMHPSQLANRPQVSDDTKGMKPMVNLQVYQPSKPKPPVNNAGTVFYPQPIAPTPYVPPQYGYQMPPFMYNGNVQYPNSMGGNTTLPVVNTYNINMDGINGDPGKLSLIYEDMMPYNGVSFGTMSTLGERKTMYSFIKAMMFSKGDGSDISLDGKGDNSLLSHLKFMDLNPYNTYKFSPNPYRGLPNNFLIYRSCYPIRHDSVGSSVVCAKNSVGMNIRIYKLTDASYNVYSTDKTKLTDFNEWREIVYYEYVREHVIKKMVCPHFSILHGYYIAEKCSIDFDKILRIKGIEPTNNPQFIKNGVPLFQQQVVPVNKIQSGGNGNSNQQVEITINPEAYFGKALVAMTESPNYNLLNWATKTYQKDGNIKRQINTGFHLDKVWFSILFQVIAGLYTMQVHKFSFNNFSVEDNIYIKDLSMGGVATKYWKYIIDGITYFVPNYGYLVLFDTNYKDNDASPGLMSNTASPYKKIFGSFMGDTVNFIDSTFDCFIQSFDSNVFSKSFTNNGGCPPPPDVLALMNKIKTEAILDTTKNINTYIYKHMRHYMHNRIGTYIRQGEKDLIQENNAQNLRKGEIVVYEEAANTYKFVMYIEPVIGLVMGQITILTRTNPTDTDIIEMNIHHGSVYRYNNVEPITQNFVAGVPVANEEELLETYIINRV